MVGEEHRDDGGSITGEDSKNDLLSGVFPELEDELKEMSESEMNPSN